MNRKKTVRRAAHIKHEKSGKAKVRPEPRSEQYFARLFRAGPAAICTTRLSDGRLIDVNEAFLDLFGYAREEAIGHTTIELHMWADPEARVDMANALKKQGRLSNMELRFRTKSGRLGVLLTSAELIDIDGEQLMLSQLVDITERERSEAEMQNSRNFLNAIIEQSPNPMWISDREGTLVRINKACCDMLRITPEEVVGRYNVLKDNIVETQGAMPLVRSVYEEGKTATFDLTYDTAKLETLELERSASIVLNVTIFPIRDTTGKITNAVIQHLNITARKKAEEALRESEERFRAVVDGAPEGIMVQSDGRFVFLNPAMVRLVGAGQAEEVLGTEVMERIAPEFRDTVRSRIQLQLETGEPGLPMELECLRLDGGRVPVETTAVAFRFRGREAYLIFVRDSTARRKAEAEREKLQAQLLQAQKMESVGRLAGGVAHDFNNILMVQRGYCEMLMQDLKTGDPLAKGLAQIDDCAKRAATLTRQLLAFSRKQTLQPRNLDLRILVKDLDDMLRRVIGEDVEMLTIAASRPAMVKADPGQIEQVLVNLAVNARDAMPQGGKLTIQVSEEVLDASYAESHVGVAPGPYVMLSVSDTGSGMDEQTQRHLFEPFFTTKGEGKGTGLGLSTVYGIVHQSGGNIWVYSEPGSGTTFKVYLPRVQAEQAPPVVEQAAVVRGQGELVLIIEDEPSLRELARMIVEKLGFRVVVTANGGEALIQVEEAGLRPDLILTDVVMPGIGGRALVERLRESLHNLKVIYMSGYTDNAIEHHGVLDSNVDFLQKPFSVAALSAKIQLVLSRR